MIGMFEHCVFHDSGVAALAKVPYQQEAGCSVLVPGVGARAAGADTSSSAPSWPLPGPAPRC